VGYFILSHPVRRIDFTASHPDYIIAALLNLLKGRPVNWLHFAIQV